MTTKPGNRICNIAATLVAAICCAVGEARAADPTATAASPAPTADRYASALDHFRAERWADAERDLREFFSSPNANADARLASARYYLAEALLRGGKPAEAVDSYRKLLDDPLDDAARAIVRFRLGEASYLGKRYPLAVEELTKFVDDYPQHPALPRALHYLGETAYAERDYRRAETALAHSTAAFPDDPAYSRVVVLQACSLMQLGRTREAWAVLAPQYFVSDSREPVDAFVVQLAATLLAAVGNDAEAATAYERLLTKPESADRRFEILTALAEIYVRQERWDDAAESARLASAAASKEQQPQALRLAAEIELARGELAAADEQYAQLVRDFPKHELAVAARLQRGRIAQEAGDWEAAAERFAELCELPRAEDAVRNEAWQGRLQALAQAKRWTDLTEIVAAARKAVTSESLRAEIDYLEGRANLGQAELDRARESFARCLSNRAADDSEVGTLARFMTGETYFLQRRYAEAIAEYDRIRSPQNTHWQAAALLQRGKCREQMNQIAEARADYDALLRDFADSAFAAEARSRLEACVARSAAAPNNTRTER